MPQAPNKIAVFLPHREVRWVPLGWQHPRDAQGRHIALDDHRRFTEETIAEYLEHDPTLTREELKTRYMPDFSAVPREQMGIAAYEITTEGTPVSPVYPDTPRGRYALLSYCARHVSVFGDSYNHSIDGWCELLFGREQTAVVDHDQETICFTEPTGEL